MKILATFPGKHGDLLWALPTVRAISETYDQPVDLQIALGIASLKPLLERQDYLGEVIVDAAWHTQDTAPMTPRTPPGMLPGYDQVYHLGYEGWPAPTLPLDVYWRATLAWGELVPIDLRRPWITAPYTLPASDVSLGFTDEHFELKYGMRWLLRQQIVHRDGQRMVEVSTSPRWATEGDIGGSDWVTAAAWIAPSRVFVGCCSALHVLACAIGTPVVLMEPAEARWNDIFYPYGKTGPQVTLVCDAAGRPTFDARTVCQVVSQILEASHARTLQQPLL